VWGDRGMQQSTVGGGRQIHNNIALNSVAGSKPSKADPAPKHNNKPHKNIRTMSNELLVVAEPKENRNKQQSAE
jgi:hypothetical protein